MNAPHWPSLTKPLAASRDAVHVVRVPLMTDNNTLERLKSLLSPDETARADRFKVPVPRRRFIVCRAVLRQLLGACVKSHPQDVAFEYGPQGKPLLRQSSSSSKGIQFSVSHSADQALIAIAVDRLTGVDIERIDPSVRILKLAQRFFSPREAAELTRLPERDQLAGFFQGWTSKEAYLKSTGCGLSFPLDKFSVSLDPHQPPRLLDVVDQPTEPARWRLLPLHPIPGFAAAIMFEADSVEPVDVQQWCWANEKSRGI